MSEGHQGINKALLEGLAAQRDAKQPAKVVAHLAALKAIWEGSPKYGIGALLEALRFCGDNGVPLPLWLSRNLHTELKRRVPKTRLMHYWRWSEFRKRRDARLLSPGGPKARPGKGYSYPDIPAQEIGYKRTLEQLAEDLSETSVAGSPEAIEYSFNQVENDLPKSQRYERTHTKRTR